MNIFGTMSSRSCSLCKVAYNDAAALCSFRAGVLTVARILHQRCCCRTVPKGCAASHKAAASLYGKPVGISVQRFAYKGSARNEHLFYTVLAKCVGFLSVGSLYLIKKKKGWRVVSILICKFV